MFFPGEQFSANQAYTCGLISHIAEGNLDEYTANLAAHIAAAQRCFWGSGTFRNFYQRKDLGIVEAYEFARRVMAGNFSLGDTKEGVSAFIEKRKSEWTS